MVADEVKVSVPDPAPLDGEEPLTLIDRRLDWAELWADETTEEWIVEPSPGARDIVARSAPETRASPGVAAADGEAIAR